jgi:hypothetical protein
VTVAFSENSTPLVRAGSRERYIQRKGTGATRRRVMAHLVDKEFVQRANTAVLLGILWAGLAVCVIGALAYDIAYWFQNW